MARKTNRFDRNQKIAKPKLSDTEVIGLSHPLMTRELTKEILSNGVLIPIDLLHRMGLLCNPMEYRSIPNGELMALADSINGLLDQQLRDAQQRNLELTGRARPLINEE